MASFRHKRGMTFTGTVTYTPAEGGEPNLLGTTITSSILDAAGKRYELTCELDEAGLVIIVSSQYPGTELWSVGPAKWDIRIEQPEFSNPVGIAIYTDTINFDIVERITPTPE